MLGLKMERPVDLEHDDTSVGKHPLAVEEPPTACLVDTDPLPRRAQQPCLTAKSADVDLRERLCSTRYVGEGETQQGSVTELADLDTRGLESFDGRETLLDRGRHQTDGTTYGPVALRRQEAGVLDAKA